MAAKKNRSKKKEQDNRMLDQTIVPTKGTAFSVGLEPGIVVDPYQQEVTGTGTWYPLITRGIGFRPTGTKGTFSYLHFLNVIGPAMVAAFQRRVNKRFDLTLANIWELIDLVVDALGVYYTIDSIVQFTSNGGANSAMIQIRRDYVTSEVLTAHEELKFRLQNCPCPPRIVQTIREIFSVHAASDMPGSNLIMFGESLTLTGDTASRPVTPTEDGFLSVGLLKGILKSLEEKSEGLAFLALIDPRYMIKTLEPAPNTAVYDPQFSTLWANSAHLYSDHEANFKAAPSVKSEETTVQYRTHTNQLDGSIYALSTVPIGEGTSTKFEPGLVRPVIDASDDKSKAVNKLDTDTRVWRGPSSQQKPTSNIQNQSMGLLYNSITYEVPKVKETPGYTDRKQDVLTLYGTDVVISASIRSMKQAAMNYQNYLFELDKLNSAND